MKDLLTVVIPLYNSENYILDALKILDSKRNDFSVVVVDDFSNDNGLKIAQDYVLKKPGSIQNRVKFIKHSGNLGLSASRNSGLDSVYSKYVHFLDADDILIIDLLMDIIDNAKTEVDIIHFGYKKFYNSSEIENIHIDNSCKSNKSLFLKGDDFLIKYLQKNRFESAVWQRCYRTEYLRDNNLRFRPNVYHEDEDWSIDTIINASSIEDHSNKKIYCYRINLNSITNDFTKKNKRASDIFNISIDKIESYKYYPSNYKLRRLILDYYSRLIMFSIQLDADYDIDKLLVSFNFSYLLRSKIKGLYLLVYSFIKK
jgi:glycosyltransferase involved in cell wall biosynthesis